jgi:hypothetical protein
MAEPVEKAAAALHYKPPGLDSRTCMSFITSANQATAIFQLLFS